MGTPPLKIMLIIKTYIGPSKIHGIGLFAGQNIKKGKIIWEFHHKLDIIISTDDISCEIIKDHIEKHAYKIYKNYNLWCLCGDNTKFMNHSYNPNVISKDDDYDVAKQDIKKGEELTIDYSTFDKDYKRKLCVKNPI